MCTVGSPYTYHKERGHFSLGGGEDISARKEVKNRTHIITISLNKNSSWHFSGSSLNFMVMKFKGRISSSLFFTEY